MSTTWLGKNPSSHNDTNVPSPTPEKKKKKNIQEKSNYREPKKRYLSQGK